MSPRIASITTVLILLLSACAGAPPALEPAADLEIPGQWSALDASASNTTTLEPTIEVWWQDFDDPALDRLIHEALEHNRGLRATAAAVDVALAQARIAGADLKPQASFDLNGAKRQQVFVGLPVPGSSGVLQSRSSNYGANLGISWEADLWGRLRAGRSAATRDAVAAQGDRVAARLSLSGQVAKVWFSLVEAERQVALAAETVDSRRTTLERVENRYANGLVSPLDVRLARTNAAQAQSTLEARRRGLDATRRQLEVLLGRYPAGSLTTAAELPSPPPPVPVGLPAELVARRPDLRAAEERLQAAGWRVAEARAAFYPRLTLNGSFGSSSDSVDDLLDSDFSVWNIAGGLLQPIFQGGRLRAAAELAEASREASLASYAQALLDAFAEVEIALAAEDLLAAEELALATAVDESKAAATQAEERYRAGVGDYLTVLESQRQAFNSESGLLSIRRQRLAQRIDLHLALGGPVPAETSDTSTLPLATHDLDTHDPVAEAESSLESL